MITVWRKPDEPTMKPSRSRKKPEVTTGRSGYSMVSEKPGATGRPDGEVVGGGGSNAIENLGTTLMLTLASWNVL